MDIRQICSWPLRFAGFLNSLANLPATLNLAKSPVLQAASPGSWQHRTLRSILRVKSQGDQRVNKFRISTQRDNFSSPLFCAYCADCLAFQYLKKNICKEFLKCDYIIRIVNMTCSSGMITRSWYIIELNYIIYLYKDK